MVNKRSVFAPVFALFVVYVMQASWHPVDAQLFGLRHPGLDYAGLVVQGRHWQVLFALTVLAFAADILKSRQRIPLPLTFIIAAAAASILWSIDRPTSFNATMLLIVTLGFAVLAIRLLGLPRAFAMVWWLGVAILFASVMLAIIGDHHALMGGVHAGTWRGLFGHKNQFGPFAATVLVMTLFGAPHLRAGLALRLAIIALAGIAVIGSRSVAAVVVLAAAAASGGLLLAQARNVNTRIILTTSAVLIAIPVAVVGSLYLDSAAAAFGRDLTLTGRTELWNAAWPFVLAAPLGYGAGTSGGEALVLALRATTGWSEAASTHNSYLRMALDIGWPATAIFIAFLLSLLIGRRGQPRADAALIAAIAAAQLVAGLSEIFAGIYPSFNLFVLLLLVAARPARITAPSSVPLASPA